MNITPATPIDFSGLSKFTNDSIANLTVLPSDPMTNLTVPPYNFTASILTALGSSGGHTWELKYYWIFATPFLLSVPLFLVAGGILRWSIQSAARYVVYWRIATCIIAPIIYL
ncbi:hypothetical protein H2199_007591 [Coniosporium tulheliwenetii]|uniref:Uncharacterized protein n=1 Tax=Coniosporium tulheliwenetii TaxID=3383036 RepID=A0ACC2YPR1_9PEZI|nr:hypothetical protein H2199_007591 [Cladosporium sp. JES 115]